MSHFDILKSGGLFTPKLGVRILNPQKFPWIYCFFQIFSDIFLFFGFFFFFYFFGIFWIFSDFLRIFLNEQPFVQNTWNALNLFIFSQSNDSNSFIAQSTGFAESVGRAGRDGSVRSAGRAQLESVGQTSPEWSI